MDRKAALLSGLEVRDWELVDIDPKACDPALWPEIVARIDMDVTPPRLVKVQGRECAAATQAEVERVVRESVEESRLAREEEKRRAAQSLAEYREAWATLAAKPKPLYAQKDGDQWAPSLDGLKVSDEGRTVDPPSRYACAYASEEAKAAVEAEYAPALAVIEAAIQTHNAEVFARDLPAALAAFEVERAEKTAREIVAKEAKARADAAKWAARLETGYWERDTGGYNERRCSAPWCARVTFPSGAKPVYEFGESTGKWGKAGLMRVECRPGDIIAWGQKDLRHPNKSAHYILIMQPNGSTLETDKTGAFRQWQQMRKPAQAEDPA